MERFRIAQVTPYTWEEPREVNDFVLRISAELRKRGHKVAVLAPSESRKLVRASRQLIGRARKDPALLFGKEAPDCLAVGHSLPFPPARRGGKLALPIDVARTIEQALTVAPLDFVHVHEPYAPSAASAALRHSRSLNVGTFHRPSERVLSTQVARRVVELFFGRLDARTASFNVTRDLVSSFFPSDYKVIEPGADPGDPSKRRAGADGEPLQILFCAEEERQSLRLFLRTLRKLPLELSWRAVIWSRHLSDAPLRLSRALRERVELRGPEHGSITAFLEQSEIFCACSLGATPAPQLVQQARATGAICVCSRLPIYEELLDDGNAGLFFEPGDNLIFLAQLQRVLEDKALRIALRRRMIRRESDWAYVAEQFEDLYRTVAARRHPQRGNQAIRRRLAKRRLIHVDLHMHTDCSPDCATPVEVLLDTAKARGLQAIAITDHNEISGALEARDRANGIKVIVAEEIKTADQGEVIGLFIEKKVPRGMTLAETIAEIRRQGGLVYVPHPFDRLHSVPDYQNLLKVVADIDIVEVFNPRIALSSFNEEAERFASKYRIVAAAGSDSHVAQGLGSVKVRMRDFDDPDEFLESLRDADIVRRHKNLVYVQTLKFLQTTGRPKPARRAARAKGINKRQG